MKGNSLLEKREMKQDVRRDFLWNAVGSLTYALASIILSFVVIRLVGSEEGGIFGFGFSTLGQQMFIISYFGIRPFHITDRRMEYRFSDYLRARWITTGLSVVGTIFFLFVMQMSGTYSVHKAIILLFLCLYKIIDGYADVYESELQRIGYLYCTGQSLFFRTLCSVLVLVGVLWMQGGLLYAAAFSVLSQIVGTWYFGARVLRKKQKETEHIDTESLSGEVSELSHGDVRRVPSGRPRSIENARKLLRATALLFVSVFLDFYVFSASKYAVDNTLSSTISGFYNILFMPASFIYLIANFMIRPALTKLADQYKEGRKAAFVATVKKMSLYVTALAVVIVVLGALLGKTALWILEWVLGDSAKGNLLPQYGTLLLLLAGGGLYALANVYYYVLVTMRGQKAIFVAYGIACVLAFFTAGPAIRSFGLPGGAWSYLFMMGFLLILFILFTMHMLRAFPDSAEASLEEG